MDDHVENKWERFEGSIESKAEAHFPFMRIRGEGQTRLSGKVLIEFGYGDYRGPLWISFWSGKDDIAFQITKLKPVGYSLKLRKIGTGCGRLCGGIAFWNFVDMKMTTKRLPIVFQGTSFGKIGVVRIVKRELR